MYKIPWVTYLWPGLPQIWRYGSWLGLAVAVGFALLLNLALMSSLVWSELTTSAMRNVLWMLLVSFWMISALAAYGWQREQISRQKQPRKQKEFEAPLAEGIEYYLQKNWFEAERIFRRLLRRNHRDTDSRLMLASLLRHTERYEEAQVQLDRLRMTEGSQKWDLEIDSEKRLLDELKLPKPQSDDTASDENGQQQEERRADQGPQQPSVEDRLAA